MGDGDECLVVGNFIHSCCRVVDAEVDEVDEAAATAKREKLAKKGIVVRFNIFF